MGQHSAIRAQVLVLKSICPGFSPQVLRFKKTTVSPVATSPPVELVAVLEGAGQPVPQDCRIESASRAHGRRLQLGRCPFGDQTMVVVGTHFSHSCLLWSSGKSPLWCMLPRDVRTEQRFANFCGFSTKPLKVKLLAGEQKATQQWLGRCPFGDPKQST